MKSLIFVAALVACVSANTSRWTRIRVKFDFSGGMQNINAFWIVGNTYAEAQSRGWVAVQNDNELNLSTLCATKRDFRVCALYDAKGTIAGIQCAIPPADVRNVPYNFTDFKVYEMKTINGEQYWTSTFYINNPREIEGDGRYLYYKLGDGLWFKNGSQYTSVPTDEATILSSTPYTKQNCLPNMGTHYYYDTKPTTQCKDLQPFFLLTTNGSVNGLGWQFFGKTTYVDINWYDDINRIATTTTVPKGPKCMADWTDTYGVISIHFYFTEEPWEIRCDQTTESSEPIPWYLNMAIFAKYVYVDLLSYPERMLYEYLHEKV